MVKTKNMLSYSRLLPTLYYSMIRFASKVPFTFEVLAQVTRDNLYSK